MFCEWAQLERKSCGDYYFICIIGPTAHDPSWRLGMLFFYKTV